jgi:hypothetical protein
MVAEPRKPFAMIVEQFFGFDQQAADFDWALRLPFELAFKIGLVFDRARAFVLI